MNFTITAPEGTTNHRDPKLLCTPAKWYNILFFFLTNYVAHAGTAVAIPGQGRAGIIFTTFLALLFPGYTIVRATRAIACHAASEKENTLKRAARAGALCMVMKRPSTGIWAAYFKKIAADDPFAYIRTLPWGSSPERTGESASRWWEAPEGYQPVVGGTRIHGKHWISDEYYLAVVPPTAELSLAFDAVDNGGPADEPNGPTTLDHSGATLSSTHNVFRLFIGLAQTVWASATVYRTPGDQIERYGYAAFGLTVVPYAFMFLLNTIANLFTPEYPAMFVIRIPAMEEAEKEGKALFAGAVRVKLQDMDAEAGAATAGPTTFLRSLSRFRNRLSRKCDRVLLNKSNTDAARGSVAPISAILNLVPLAVVGSLSGFQKGRSTEVERGFVISWLVMGVFYDFNHGMTGLSINHEQVRTPRTTAVEIFAHNAAKITTLAVLGGIPAIGGMAVVGRMICDYGVCRLL